MFKVTVDYPNADSELQVLKAHNAEQAFTRLDSVQPIMTKEDLLAMRAMAQNVHVDEALMRYIVSIVQSTRSHNAIYVGASPRASIALLQASKAYAFLNNRSFVIPEDVKMLAVPTLQHRISLTAEAEMEGLTVQKVVRDIIEKVEVPK